MATQSDQHALAPSDGWYIGLMSGTSMDGVDAVLVRFAQSAGASAAQVLAAAHTPFAPALRAQLAELQHSGADEIRREALAANQLMRVYADCVAQLLRKTDLLPRDICALGAHGQTVRHQPQHGYSRQSSNPALLAELCGIDVVADFRSRDIAAGGQGAPLVPAFHQWLFASPTSTRVIVNIGGIANISVIAADGATVGFDTGPGNVLLDSWIAQHHGHAYDADGAWGASGRVDQTLLSDLLSDPYFAAPAPKSTGRDLFDSAWLLARVTGHDQLAPADVQATLAQLTAQSIASAIAQVARDIDAVYVCGGGAFNVDLMRRLQASLAAHAISAPLASTAALGVPPDQVEALAFAWLARQCVLRQSGNLPAVTGASGARILGAIYPA